MFRKSLEDSVPIFKAAAGYRNVTLSQIESILAQKEDIWLFMLGSAAMAEPNQQQCADALKQLENIVAEMADMVKIGVALVSLDEAESAAEELKPERVTGSQYDAEVLFSRSACKQLLL